jgi:hypothetical protein
LFSYSDVLSIKLLQVVPSAITDIERCIGSALERLEESRDL